GGVAVELIDTAGWQDASDTIAEQAQRLGREQSARADVILWCVEAGGAFDPSDEARLQATGAEVLRVRTKADLGERRGVSPTCLDDETRRADATTLASSTVTPGGTDALRAALT